jgi:hypothetical protein
VSLHALLDDAGRFGPEYGDGLASHLPMGLVALQALGADGPHLQAFFRTESAHLLPAPSPQAWPSGDAWAGRFGDITAWPVYHHLFSQWLAAEGAADVLAQVLPQLMPGCAAAAFHGPIRAAAALRAGHAGELAAGLAYWAARHQPLAPLPARAGTVADPLTLLRRLPAVPSKRPHPMKTRAAVAWKAGAPLTIETVDLEGPRRRGAGRDQGHRHLPHRLLHPQLGRRPRRPVPRHPGPRRRGRGGGRGPGRAGLRKPGDHVIPLYTPECRQCKFCLSRKTNLCQDPRHPGQGPDARRQQPLLLNGQPILHYMGTSTFATTSWCPRSRWPRSGPTRPSTRSATSAAA